MPTKQRIKLIAQGGLVVDLPMIAAVDFSTCGQYRFVSPGSIVGEVVLATGASLPGALGVMQNTPAAGGPARVRVFGISTITACLGACNLINGTYITAGSNGTACYAGVAGVTLARWLSASVASTGSTTTGCAFVNCAGAPSACLGSAS